MRQKRLVGGDHIFACGDGGLGRGLGRAVAAAHELDEDIDIVALGEHHGIVFPGVMVDVDAPVLAARAGGHGGDLDGPTGAHRQEIGLLADNLDHSGADGPQTGNPKAQRLAHLTLPFR